MEEDPQDSNSLSQLLIPLLKGPLYQDQHSREWGQLLQQQAILSDYLATMGLVVFIDEQEGYAFLRQDDFSDQDKPPPRLIQRRPLGFPVSVLCLLLRQWLLENDTRDGNIRAIIERRQIREELSLYLPEKGSEAKQEEAIDRHIKKVMDLGLLRPLKDDDQRFEIQRITRALINADWLGDLNTKLKEYEAYARSLN